MFSPFAKKWPFFFLRRIWSSSFSFVLVQRELEFYDV